MTAYEERFGGVGRLYGISALDKLRRARALVVGLGGVGSWAAEALVRSGVGGVTLLDLDDVCVTNINRQLPALADTVGRPKADVLAERARSISPECAVRAAHAFLGSRNAAEFLNKTVADVVLDAIDEPATKALILDTCRREGLSVITAGGAGGKRDSTAIRVNELASTGGDPLLKQVRKALRDTHGWPLGESFGVRAIYSAEAPWFPESDGGVCQTRKENGSLRMDCAAGYGAACHVTGGFGLAMAGEALNQLLR